MFNNNRQDNLDFHPLVYDTVMTIAIKPAVKFYGGATIGGVDHIKDLEAPYLLAPVHRSMKDIPILGVAVDRAIDKRVHFMGKQELWRFPVFGSLLYACGAFPIDRSKPLDNHLLAITNTQSEQPEKRKTPDKTLGIIDKIIQRTGIIAVFPEGTREHGDEIIEHHIKKGVVQIALKYGLKIVPVGIDGTETNNNRPNSVYFGEPIEVEKAESEIFSSGRQMVKIINPIHKQLYNGLSDAQKRAIQMNE